MAVPFVCYICISSAFTDKIPVTIACFYVIVLLLEIITTFHLINPLIPHFDIKFEAFRLNIAQGD